MGFTDAFDFNPDRRSDIADVGDSRSSTVASFYQNDKDELVFLPETTCSVGVYPKAFAGVSWLRYEIEIERPKFNEWNAGEQYAAGDLCKTKIEGKKSFLFWQAKVGTNSDSFDLAQWRQVTHRPVLFACPRPRQSKAVNYEPNTRLFRFRVGVKDEDRETRWNRGLEFQQSCSKKYEGKDIEQTDRNAIVRSRFLEWFENTNRDYSHGDDRFLRAGFYKLDNGFELRRDVSGQIFGFYFPGITKTSSRTEVRARAFGTAGQIGRNVESPDSKPVFDLVMAQLTSELEFAAKSCSAMQPSDMKRKYVFWPRALILKQRSKKGNHEEPSFTLFSKQEDTLVELMSLAVYQAMAGPDSTDYRQEDREAKTYWAGKKVHQLAITIFRAYLWKQWKEFAPEQLGTNGKEVNLTDFLKDRKEDESIGHADYDESDFLDEDDDLGDEDDDLGDEDDDLGGEDDDSDEAS